MPKKNIDSRLHDLFAVFEEQENHLDPNAAQERDNREVVRTILLEMEAPTPRISEPAAPQNILPDVAPEPARPIEMPVQPILYENEQMGFAYNGNDLVPLQGLPPRDTERTNVIETPLIDAGEEIGKMAIEAGTKLEWTPQEQGLVDAVAQQVSLQIQSLRLLSSAERARAEAQSATRRFIHESWDSYLDGIRKNERIGYAYDQSAVKPFIDASPAEMNHEESVNVLDEQIGQMLLKTDQDRPLSPDDRSMVAAVAQQVGQQVENLRLLAEAAHARAEAEEATRRLTREGWKDYVEGKEDVTPGFIYDQNQVTSLNGTPHKVSLSQPLVVRGETIGELAIAGVEQVSTDAVGLMAEIALQTSIHLETLRLNEELRKRADELQELDRLKSSFLANMSHELRTPLNSILGFSDVILEGIDGPLTDYMENDLRLIQKNGLHLLHLINDVLDMAKIESGRMNLHPEKIKLDDVLTEVISITSSLAGEKNLEVVIEPDSNKGTEITADVTRLRQVMINLVNNSIKFTDSGSVSLRVDEVAGDQVRIAVKDTGIGIPPDQLETIFMEFSQVDTTTTRKVGGTGLGLPISRQLVELHGGRLWAESRNIPGEGSTFFVQLPREAVLSDHVEIIAK